MNGERVEEDFADEQRRMMRVALARHMKRELIEGEQDRLTKVKTYAWYIHTEIYIYIFFCIAPVS